MRIRKFRKEDAKKASRLIRQAQLITLKDYYPRKIIDWFCKINTPSKIIAKSKKIELFVAVEGDKILGINGLKEDQVKKFYVNPAYQGRGVGRKLIKNIENTARKRKIRKLVVRSSLYAEGFYKKMGFRRIKKIKSGRGNIEFDEIFMEKKLE
jgi:N-acetylglutamate synthase-like GNAT family acetyltransferase